MLSSRPIHLPTDGTHFPLKTPGRTMKNRAENAVGPMTVGRAGGKAMGLKTPFAGGSGKPEILLKERPQTVLRPKPLGDKTPFPNRVSNIQNFQTPATGGKLKQLSFLPPNEGIDGGSPRASATRRHSRPPRKSFETPMNNGNHWDVSDLDIEVQAIREEVGVKEPEEDWGEVEYGPPNTLHLVYDPPIDIDLPNYKDVGKKLKEMRYTPWIDEYEPPEIDVKPEDVQVPLWEDLGFELNELEDDDPFAQLRSSAKPQPATPNTTAPIRSASTRAGTVTRKTVASAGSALASSKVPVVKAASTARPKTTGVATNATSVRPGTASTRPVAARPGTSAAVSRPATAAVRPRAATTATAATQTGISSSTRTRTTPSTRTGASGTTRPGTSVTSLSRVTSTSAMSRATSASLRRAPAANSTATLATGSNNVDVPVLLMNAPTEVEDFIFDI